MHIGLTQRIFEIKGRLYDTIDHGWYSFLHGHQLTFIPNTLNQNFNKIAVDIDLLIITGGPDHELRKQVETNIVNAAILNKKPIVGICNGAFLLTSLFGGELQLKAKKDHKGNDHLVYYNNESYMVNSYHSNVISKPPTDTTTIVRDAEGDCEAFIGKNMAGIVWHPEQMLVPWMPQEVYKFFN